MRNIGLDDVAYSTKIHLKYLKALESDDLEHLPGKTFAKGFVGSYARAIGLDADEALLHLEENLRTGIGPRNDKKSEKWNWLEPFKKRWKPYAWFGLFLFVLAIIFYFQSL